MRSIVSLLLALALARTSYANGRPAGVRTIDFRPGHPEQVIAGTTFGPVVSSDGGATWRWMCEGAVGYGGAYDPDYAYAASGAIFATTFDGLRVNRNGCTYDPTPLGTTFVSHVEVPTALAVIASAADPSDVAIYRSADDGASFPLSASPGLADDWWQSLRTAPSDPLRVYLTGYRIVDGVRETLLFTSGDGGATFTPMVTTNLMLTQSSTVSIVGVAPTAPLTVYALVTFETGNTTDGIYVSTDAGGSWTHLVSGLGLQAFLARANGDLVVTGATIAKVSTNGGGTWTDFAAPSTINCLAERSDGVVWACTQNFGAASYGIMASTNLATWTGVLRFQDLVGPVECPAGTVQHDTCYVQWCTLRQQFAIAPDPTGCEPPPDGTHDGIVDAASPPPDASMTRHGGGGCCEVSGGGSGSLVLALLVALTLSRRSPAMGTRRRCRPAGDPRGHGSRSRRW